MRSKRRFPAMSSRRRFKKRQLYRVFAVVCGKIHLPREGPGHIFTSLMASVSTFKLKMLRRAPSVVALALQVLGTGLAPGWGSGARGRGLWKCRQGKGPHG